MDSPMLGSAMAAIKEFHYDKGISPRCEMVTLNETCDSLNATVAKMRTCAEYLEQYCDPKYDARYLRAHLILEEVAETLESLFRGDVVETLDGLADSIYVIVGTAVQFGLPLDLAFDEVHASNMSKAPKTGARLRDKGNSYVPPNIKSCLVGTPYYIESVQGETSFDMHEWMEKTYPDIVTKWGNALRGVLVTSTVAGKLEHTYVIEYPQGTTTIDAEPRPNAVIAGIILDAWNTHRLMS